MQYLLAVHHDFDDALPAEDEMLQTFADVDAFNDEVREAGSWVFAGGLTAPSSATVVDATGGDHVVTDGPYLEGREVLGGFWIVEVADLDAALDLARRASVACRGPVEVRPFQAEPED